MLANKSIKRTNKVGLLIQNWGQTIKYKNKETSKQIETKMEKTGFLLQKPLISKQYIVFSPMKTHHFRYISMNRVLIP